MASGKAIVEAASILVPLVGAYTKLAEQSGAPGQLKHNVVAEEIEVAYKNLQATKSIKEINDIPWELVAPVIVPVTSGLISAIVQIFNRLGVFIKNIVSD